jgi:hypothetical protein
VRKHKPMKEEYILCRNEQVAQSADVSLQHTIPHVFKFLQQLPYASICLCAYL